MGKSQVDYTVLRRRVKYPRLELKTGELVIIMPKDRSCDPANLFLRHCRWVERKAGFVERIKEKAKKLRAHTRSREDFHRLLSQYVEDSQDRFGVKGCSVRIQSLKSKWGSCSAKGNLTFNDLLRFLPAELIRYVVFHEVCHLRILRHNSLFWQVLGEEYPQAQVCEENLFSYWFMLHAQGKE